MHGPYRFVPPTSAVARALAAGLLAGAAAAQTQTQCFTDHVVLQPTDWNGVMNLQKFDPALGILQSVTVQLDAQVTGEAKAENTAPFAVTETLTFAAAIDVQFQGSTLVAATPQQQFVDSLAPFDGVIDFAGPSGVTHANIDLSDQQVVTPANLAPYIGAGPLDLPVSAVGASTGSGAGNIVRQFITNAGATVTVCYTYALDCDENGVPDDQDIANGTLTDGDLDGVPDECQCFVAQYCQTSPNTVGAGGLIGSSGTPSLSANHFFLRAGHLPPGEPGIFFFGDFAVDPPLTFGDGFRCVGGNTVRLLPPLHASPQGTVTRQLDFSQPPASLFLPGQTRYFQFWYRDHPQVGVGFNLTNGLAVTFCL